MKLVGIARIFPARRRSVRQKSPRLAGDAGTRVPVPAAAEPVAGRTFVLSHLDCERLLIRDLLTTATEMRRRGRERFGDQHQVLMEVVRWYARREVQRIKGKK